MSKRYFKTEPAHVQGTCVRCGIRPQTREAPNRYRPLCRKCVRERHLENGNVKLAKTKGPKPEKALRKKHLKDSCEKCGFKAVHRCQLDIDHKDGNNANDAPENLQTLCANCHRLKTFRESDWLDWGALS